MDLLREIELFLERLENNPADCDLDAIKGYLVTAHELARDGLERSHLASLVPQLRGEITELSETVHSLTESLNSAKEQNRELSKLQPVLDNLRADTEGKASLCEYSPDHLRRRRSSIANASVDELLSLRESVLSDFNATWNHSPQSMSVSDSSSPRSLNLSNFKSGG